MKFRIKKALLSVTRQWRDEFVIFSFVALLSGAGFLSLLSDFTADFGFQVLRRPATGNVVIVQIDAKSLKLLNHWPWPRSQHGLLTDRLVEAGADTIAIDIDFSSPSSPREDAALAAAIMRADGRVVLPSFAQFASTNASDVVETLPIEALRGSALVGNANFFAPRGIVRRANLGIETLKGEFQPSFTSLLSQVELASAQPFDIDYSIDLKTIPRLSYVDVLNGSFNPNIIRGRRVIVGATAIELGDRVSVPVYGLVAGVELQALIADSILQGRVFTNAGWIGQFLLIGIVVGYFRPGNRNWSNGRIVRSSAILGLGLIVVWLGALEFATLVIDPVSGFVAISCSLLFVGMREFSSRSVTVMRERTTSSLRRMMIELIVEESSDGVVVVGQSGRVELCNEQAACLLSTTRKALSGRSVDGHLPRFDAIAIESGQAANASRRCDLPLEGAGNQLVVELTVRRTHLPVIAGVDEQHAVSIDVYTLRDVTALRRARAAELRAQEERLFAERAKNNFIANMSHELRTPLNAIIGFSDMLAAEMLGAVEVRAYVEHADIVSKSGHHLLALINNVLDVARLDSTVADVEISDFEFCEVADPIVVLLKRLRDYKDQVIEISTGPEASSLSCDHKVLKQILYNLLSNAVKFSPNGSLVKLSTWIDGADFHFEVADQGEGLDKSILPHVTDLFGHAESGFIRRHDGVGVGLYLVKRCLEKLNGRLSFERNGNSGTRARVILPGAALVRSKVQAA